MNPPKRWLPILISLTLSACSTGITDSGGTPPAVDATTGLSSISGSKSALGPQSGQMLQAINAARAQARTCKKPDGSLENRPAVPALKWNDRLEVAAAVHTQDMVDHNFFAHQGSDQSWPWDRALKAGYAYKSIGENIAAGQATINVAVQDWLASKDGHCQAIMDPTYQEIGAAMLDGSPGDTYTTYWTLDFGRR